MSAEFLRALTFVLNHEGGWSDNPLDAGGATMHGITLATYTAWRAAHGYAAPSKAALKEITDDEVAEIYYRNYWQASGCEMLKMPLALVVFDTSVLHGVGAAQKWLTASRDKVDVFLSLRLRSYPAMKTWATFGAGWVNRAADLLKEAAN